MESILSVQRTSFAAVVLPVLVWLSASQAPVEETPTGGEARPNVLLPSRVEASSGQVTLYADFAGARRGWPVDLYLVNDSAQPLDPCGVAGNLVVKLEVQRDDGSWARAQSHPEIWSGCGGDVSTRTLPPGHHFRLHGHAPSSGRPALVRYRLYSDPQVSSNHGPGRFNPVQVMLASQDGLAVALARSEKDVATLRDILLHPKRELYSAESLAFHALLEVDPAELQRVVAEARAEPGHRVRRRFFDLVMSHRREPQRTRESGNVPLARAGLSAPEMPR